ncbi:unnamed protein product [Psylliodes chrysocephalus]|uniref:Uncharacterized protein n=1 Tax=Psylliodes chrysocephalus TaxID=3402493 RepID=A0A9P0DEK6_9CUCU|nr:unnamed protein product [Psylliodes chrysocephala]
MSFFNRYLYQVVFCVLFLNQISVIVNQCMNNEFSMSDEEDNGILSKYLEKLEFYSGLSNIKPSIIVNCQIPQCVVNSQGSAIWEARLTFYTPFIMNSSRNARSRTLDGCLCHSRNKNEFQNCMQEVRNIMSAQLDTSLLDEFRKRVEMNGCSGYAENCLQQT